jgi:hypothetical protein
VFSTPFGVEFISSALWGWTVAATDSRSARPQYTPGGVLTVELLKVYQQSRSFTGMDMRFTNTSERALSWWSIGMEVYDKDGQYLGRGDGLVTDLRAGESQVVQVVIETQARSILRWRATLGTVRGYDSWQSLTPFYQLDVKASASTPSRR